MSPAWPGSCLTTGLPGNPTCHGAATPARHNGCACAVDAGTATAEHTCPEPLLRNERSHRKEKPTHCSKAPAEPKNIRKHSSLKCQQPAPKITLKKQLPGYTKRGPSIRRCVIQPLKGRRKEKERKTALVVQWLRIHLPGQATWVRSLVWEHSTHHRAPKPMQHIS